MTMAIATQEQVEIEGSLKKVKAAPVEEISVATALDLETALRLLQKMANEGLVALQPSRKYPQEEIAVGTDKLLRNAR
jgi:hypothetical protein